MKPAFALDFRDNAIALLHRASGSWHQVGAVAVDAPDLEEALGYLRATALGLSPRGISTKLVIPNDQILYMQVNAPGPDSASRRKQISAALEGRTPYAVSDLVFDWWGTGADVQVAVIARETLAEAEAFAVEHRFNPVSFVAAPDLADFRGEPWFGQSKLAATLLAKGEKVERDQDPISILSRAMASSEAETPVGAPGLAPEPMPVAAVVKPEPEAPMPEPTPAPMPAPLPEPKPEPMHEPEPRPEPKLADVPPAVPVEASRSEPVSEKVEPFPDPVVAIAPAVPAAEIKTTEIIAADIEAPMAVDVPDDTPEQPPLKAPPVKAAAERPALAKVTDIGIVDDVPPPAPGAVAMPFSSRRAAQPTVEVRERATSGQTSEKKSDTRPPAPVTAAPKPMQAVPAPGAAAAFANAATASRPPQSAASPRPALAAARPAAGGKTARGFGAVVTAPNIAGTKKPRSATIAADARVNIRPDPSKLAPSQKSAPTSGGGLSGRTPAKTARPKYLGLVLTVLLLLLLALVAAWSSFSLASLQGGQDTTATADTSSEPLPEDEMLADLQDPADFAPVGDVAPLDDLAANEPVAELSLAPQDPAAATLAAEVPLPEPPAAEAVAPETAVAEVPAQPVAEAPPPPVAEPAPETGIAAEGAGNGAAPPDDPQDEIFLATADAPPNTPDPLSLPQPDARGDPLPAAQLAPPPFGTVYQFDADGLIRPTPEGIITPEGVLLIAGAPPVVPPQRPATAAPDPAATDLSAPIVSDAAPIVSDAAPLGTANAPDASEPVPIVSDPALAGARPKTRPENLAPGAPSAEDDASLAPKADSRFAGLKPRARTAVVLAAGEEARASAAAASLIAQADAAALEAAKPTVLAVAISRKPAARPRDFARATENAIAVSLPVAQPEPLSEPEPKAQQDDGDSEPELASVAPSIPTRASVAKQATFKNAINLSKINLIGVYGSQSNRYALIRQANGRFKKVQVGDNIDGGRIAAITASEVRYQKGSRLITLAMPKG